MPDLAWRIVKGTTNLEIGNLEDTTSEVTDSLLKYRIVQANLQRKRLATQELLLEAQKRKLSFAVVQEPYVGAVGELKRYTGTRVIQSGPMRAKPVKAAIIVFDDEIQILTNSTISSENIAVAILKTNKWTVGVISVYFEDSMPLEPYLDRLKEVCESLQTNKIIIGGDVNAWSTWWGGEVEDSRGEVLRGFLDEIDLHILNQGTDPTFDTIRGGRVFTSNVDITVCTAGVLPNIQNWRVDKSVTSSDHNAITFDLCLEKPSEGKPKSSTRIYNTRKANWSEFTVEVKNSLEESNVTVENIRNLQTKEELESTVKTYIQIIDTACKNKIPLIKRIKKQNYLPWWTNELESLKRDVATKRRRIVCAAPRRRKHVVDEYLKAKIKYEEEAANAQTESWKRFCTKQDRESLWDSIYRVIRNTSGRNEDLLLVGGGTVLSPEKSVALLAATFFPSDNRDEDNDIHESIRESAGKISEALPDDTDDPPFTEAELKRTLHSFNPKKAPGPDGFTSDICQRAICANMEVFLEIVNRCLSLSCFPSPWKEAAVVVLRKPGKSDYSQAKSYRPIGLLSVLGKVLEKMMVRRVRWHLLPRTNPRQYGFVPQRCTEDALYDLMRHVKSKLEQKEITVMVSLDIEGAFDSAWWPAIRCQLVQKKCPLNLRRMIDNYFESRKVVVHYAGKTCQRETDKGCVQGSIGGPTFWNLLLDPLLDEMDTCGIYAQAFADDVVLVFSGQSTSKIEQEANGTLARVHEWGIKNKLKFAAHKTNAMIITKKLKFDAPRLHMGGEAIQTVEEIKILGLTIDKKLTFNSHVSNVCRRAANIYKNLARTAKIEWGLNPEITRTIYVSVIEPIILYAAGVWALAAQKISVQKQLNTIQRGFAQKICRSYRTVSLNAALVLAGLFPLDLRIGEAAQLYEAKRGKPSLDHEDRQFEERVCFTQAPHPAKEMDIEFECLNDMRTETVEKHHLPETLIFTDGSKIDGKVGAAFTYWTKGTETRTKKLKLGSFCTVFQAELYALHQATELLCRVKQDTVGILSDSRSALELVRNPDTFHPLAFGIRQNIAKLKGSGCIIQLYWIRAHVGVPGNERADELAKQAALYTKTLPHYDKSPVSYEKLKIRQTTIQKWGQRYTEGDTASVTKLFLPEVAGAYKIIRKFKLTPIMTQVMTGHGGFSAYLNRFKCKDSPACICDPGKDETILHLLLECPKYDVIRYNLECETNIKVTTTSLCEMMAGKDSRLYLEQFCAKVANDAKKRNNTR